VGHRRQEKEMNVYCTLLGGVAARHRAGIYFARAVTVAIFMAAVHGSVFMFLCRTRLCRMAIPVNGALVSGAASASNGQKGCAGHRRIDQQEGHQTNAGCHPTVLGICRFNHDLRVDS